MKLKDENYRPAHIEFNVADDGLGMPETFGEFETAEDAAKFIGGSLVSVNQGITVSRHMDFKEKVELREEYQEVLENKLPIEERKHVQSQQSLAEAKKREKDCGDMVNATIMEATSLAAEVKRGLKEMNLDENYTSRIAFKGRYYFYTYMDKRLTLCKIQDIPVNEKGEIFNSMCANEEFIENNFGAAKP